MTEISVIMPCHNRAYDLWRTLRAYDNQKTNFEFEVIAIDDASTDNTYQILSDYTPQNFKLKIFRHEKNLGPAAARNTGISFAESPLLLFVGDDILPLENFIEGHLLNHKKYPQKNIAILGRVVWPPDMPRNNLMSHIDGIGAQQFSFYYMKEDVKYDFRHFYTCNISIKKEFLKLEKKWFDTDFIYPAFEDAELGYRLANKGLEILYKPELLGYHYHYHTSWSFSLRQYKSGMMSYLLIQKHPQILGVLRGQMRRFLRVLIHSLLIPSTKDDNEGEKWKSAIRLLSYYESLPNNFVDYLFLKVLDYSYYNGFIDAILSKSNRNAHVRYSHYLLYLKPAIMTFFQKLDSYEKNEVFVQSGFFYEIN